MPIVMQLQDAEYDVLHIPAKPGQLEARVIRFATETGIQVVIPLVGEPAITKFDSKWRGIDVPTPHFGDALDLRRGPGPGPGNNHRGGGGSAPKT